MKFYGEPNLSVFSSKRKGNKMIKKLLFKFNENGEYETDDIKLIEKLKLHFKYEDTIYRCKKCDYQTTNKGDLMAHYRKEHPKGGD